MKRSIILLLFFFIFTIFVTKSNGLNNGLARLPPMGWSTWCTDDIVECLDDFCDENEIRSIADAMSSNGMLKLGYEYVNLDDCWAGPRDSNGNVTADYSRFPSGMKALADYVHSKGLKLGLYTCAGNQTCKGNRPGSWGHFEQDANTYAQWGIDQVKMDWCHHPPISPPIVYGMMRDALNKTNRPILFSICEWGEDEPWKWGMETGNEWRVGPDHLPFYWLPYTDQGTVNIIQNMAYKSNFSGPGGWNDPDFLMTGAITMSQTDSTTEFSFWSLFAAPLIVCTDIRDLSNKGEILLNNEVIAINQDELAIAGDIVANYTDTLGQVWSKPLANGDIAVILFNPNFWVWIDVNVTWSQLNIEGSYLVRDLWAHQNIGNFDQGYIAEVEPHGVSMIRISPAKQIPIIIHQ